MDRELFRRLVIRDLSGELDDHDGQILLQALQDDPELVREQSVLQTIWKKSLAYDHEIQAPNMEHAWRNFAEQAFDEVPQEKTITRQLWIGVARVAATVAFIIGGFAVWQMLKTPSSEMVSLASAETESMKVSLPDGSVVDLDKGSTLTYQKPFKEREVHLEGQAFFEVEHLSEDQPFTVVSNQTRTTVLGTSFSVSSEGMQVRVYVQSGRVAFQKMESEEQVILTPNHTGLYVGPSQPLSSKLEEDPNVLSWSTKVLNFENVPLRQIFTDIERHYDVTFDIENPAVLDCTYNTVLENVQLQDVIEELSFALNLEFTQRTQEKYEVAGIGCPK